MNVLAQLVLMLKLFALITENNSLMVFPKKENDSLSSAAEYHYGLKPPPYKKILLPRKGNKQRKVYRPANVGYKVYENYPSIKKENYPTRHHYRLPIKKENPKPIYITTTEIPRLKEYPTYNIPKKWAAPVSNAIEEPNNKHEDENSEHDVPRPVIDPAASFPSFGHEAPRKGKIYSKPGEWATPDPESGINLDFTPVQTYTQVRKTNTVKHVPQSEAFKDATSQEELLNAHRLKEVLRTKKIQEVYSEEGYEDSGYDHGGHIRHAEHDEAYAAEDQGQFKIKDEYHPPSQDSANEETRETPSMTVKRDDKAQENQNKASNVEPKITRSRTETRSTSVEYARSPKKYKGAHKFSSKIKSRQKNDEGKVKVKGYAFPPTEKTNSEVWALPTVFDELSTETSHTKFEKEFTSFTTKASPNPFSTSTPSLEKQNDKINKSKNLTEKKNRPYFNKNKLTTTTTTTTTTSTEKPENIVAIEKQINNYSSKYLGAPINVNGNVSKPHIMLTKNKEKTVNKTSKYQKLYNKPPKRARLEPPKLKFAATKSASNLKEFVIETDEDHGEKPEKRIVLPTIGYINSLTSAHFGKEGLTDKNEEKPPGLTTALNLTQAINYLRFNTKGSHPSPLEESGATEIPEFEPMKLKRSKTTKVKRDLTNATEPVEKAETVDGKEESDSEIVHDKKNDEIAEEERKRIEEENREKEKYEKELSEEITKQEKKILNEALGNLGVIEDPGERFPSFPMGSQTGKPEDYKFSTTPKPIDVKKYPFYFSKSVPKDSPLRYATHPGYFPRKSGHRMEFYENRDRVMQCPDVNLNLEDIPKSNSTKDMKVQPGENPRIVGLGDKITCLKIKYFDEDPLDSPFFRESEIDYVGKPKRNKQPIQNVSASRKHPVLDSKGAYSVNSRKKIRRDGLLIKHPSNTNETTLRYHSSYTYHPNKTLQIMIKDQKAESNAPLGTQIKYNSNGNKIPIQNETSVAETKRIPQVYNGSREAVKDRIIPVKEQIDEPPSNYYIKTSGKIVSPYGPKRKIIRPNYYRSPIPMPTRIISTRNRIFIPHNCMHMITKMSVLEDDRNLIVDCKDATLIQEYRNGAKHIKIMPKIYPIIKPTSTLKPEVEENPQKNSPQETLPTPKSMVMQKKNTKPLPPKIRPRYPFSISIKETYADQSDWIPMVSYPPVPNTIVTTISPHRFGRKSDEMIPTTNESISNASSNHYIIDELKEDEDVRKGEVIEDKAHVFNLMNETESANATTETTTQGLEPFESLRTKETKREKRETENSKIKKKSKVTPDKKLLDEFHGKKRVEKSLDEATDLGINSPDDFTGKISATNDGTTITSRDFKGKISKKYVLKRPSKKSTGRKLKVQNETGKIDEKELRKVNKPIVIEEATTQTNEISTPSMKKLSQVTKNPNPEEGILQAKKPNDLDTDDDKVMKTISMEKKIIHRNSTVEDEKSPVRRGSRYVQGSEGPILYYVIDKKTGQGRWLTNYEGDETEEKNSKVRSDPGKDSEFEKMNYGSKNDRKVQKRKIRKNFLKRRLNKSTSESNVEK